MKKITALCMVIGIIVVAGYLLATPRKPAPVSSGKGNDRQAQEVKAVPQEQGLKPPQPPPTPIPSPAARTNSLPLTGHDLDGAIQKAGAANDPGDILEQARADEIIARLKGETTAQALENANNVNDFYYPGHISSGTEKALDAILQLLSNRRTMKLYAELKAESPAQRHQYLKTYFDRFLKLYQDQVMLFRKNGGEGKSTDTLHFILYGIGGYNIKNECVPMSGNRQALRMVVFLAATLPDPLLFPDIEDVFKHPVAGFEIDWRDLILGMKYSLESNPLFSMYFIDQIRFLMHHGGKDQGEAGLEGLEPYFKSWKTRTVHIPHYTCKVSPFEWRARPGEPVDWSQGGEEFILLGFEVPKEVVKLEDDESLKLSQSLKELKELMKSQGGH